MFNIYLIESYINDDKIYKIGFTRREINKRIAEFRTGNVSDFKLIHNYSSKWGSKIERDLHKLHKNKSIKGEWFKLDEVDVNEFISYCEKRDAMYDIISNTTYYQDRGNRF